jgi:hypothetical protein
MEPISEVLGTVVSELVDLEWSAGRLDRAWTLGTAAADALLPGFEPEALARVSGS